MKICYIGQLRGDLDEGMRNLTYHLDHQFRKNHDVQAYDPRDYKTKEFWYRIKSFNPDIIHYLHGPTLKSFVLMKLLSICCPNAKSVVSATHPVLSYVDWQMIRFVKSDLVLTQSIDTDLKFRKVGAKTKPLPCGVDTKKYAPISPEEKKILREKYGIKKDTFLILHIGSVRQERNIQILSDLQKKGNQILIVGPKSTGHNKELYESLTRSGCKVWLEYISNIQEIYAIADCYIYPTISNYDMLGRAKIASIEMPLTVLEAMACGLPVISTKFGALPRFLQSKDGLIFVDRWEDIPSALDKIKNGVQVKTREQAQNYAWEKITIALERYYAETLQI